MVDSLPKKEKKKRGKLNGLDEGRGLRGDRHNRGHCICLLDQPPACKRQMRFNGTNCSRPGIRR